MFKLRFLLILFTCLLLIGCEKEDVTSKSPLSAEQMIKTLRLEATSPDDFNNKLLKEGFSIDNSSSLKSGTNKLGDQITFTYSIYRKDKYGYIHVEFSEVNEKDTDELRLGFDKQETQLPHLIHSDGLGIPSDFYRLKVLNNLENQWIGIYFENKNETIAHGEITLNYGNNRWRSTY